MPTWLIAVWNGIKWVGGAVVRLVQGKREADLKQVEDLQAGVEARDEEADKRAEVSAAVRSSSDDANTTPLRVVKP